MEPPKNNAQSEDETTVALKKKRLRRVSFADNEITSVHVFRRDDDSSSPSEAPSDPSIVGFFRDLASDSDYDDKEQPQLHEEAEDGNSFLRPIGSPYSGDNSTADEGDDDDDDFRGPVSAHFIRPERLSDSGVSDDVTMDSTAFSMHYRSLARSDSGDIKTRQFDVTTPNSHSRGSYMELTEPKWCGVVLDANSAGKDSNDMSIEGEQQRGSEYDILPSPAFDAAILVQGAPNDSPQRSLEGSVASPPFTQSHQIQPSDSAIEEIKESAKDAIDLSVCRQLDFENANRETSLRVGEHKGMVLDSDCKSDKVDRNPIYESTPLLLSGRKQSFTRSPVSSAHAGNITPRLEQSALHGPEVSVAHRATSSSSSARSSISKMVTIEPPAMSSLKKGMDVLKARLSKYTPGFPLSNEKNQEYKQDESRQIPLGEKLFSLTPSSNTYKGLGYSNDRRIPSLKSISKLSQNEETVDTKMAEGDLNSISASPSQLTHLMKVGDVDLADSSGKDEILVPSFSIQQVTPQLCSPQDVSPKCTVDGHGPDNNHHSVLNVAQSPLTKSGIGISSGKKRKGVQMLRNGDKIDKIGRIDRTPEAHSNGSGDIELVLEQTGSTRRERGMLGNQTSNDGDLFLKNFLDRTTHLLPPSVDKLNLRLIGRLEDILVDLQKVKKTEIVCSEIQSQHKITDPLNIHRDKRVAETRILLHSIAYEKAKLQLLHIKHDKLLEKGQQVSTGLQECEMIKLNFIPSFKRGAVDTQANYSFSKGKSQVSCKKVLEKKQELESLESKAKSLSEFLRSHCKMEGDQSFTDTVKAVSGYLRKRMPCKSIRQNLKLWEIEDFERKDDCHKVCLNYCGYVTQRVTVNTGQSSIITSSSLNDVNIGKTFPNLESFSAFVFVLNPHSTKKSTLSSSMAREIQITSSLLSNLLDVVEEVQSARIEIRNLVDAKFYSHSGSGFAVQRLDLQLSFIDFHSGRKVKAIFDITCLKCGVYPSGVVPSQIFEPSGAEQKSLPSSLAHEIRTATERVRVGYSRIIKLCRCISYAVHSGFLQNQMIGN
ncbi:uncharacterized protein LOC124847052 isoform X1 [Vigna umbellata]|uniref:uncharacterized protein LOC124847052 isoform X1 n=1 Tax=Vigna umbellata TaxID=87088 RepID=UPI001F5FAB6A|nr:uncharacterized protein LOC124847052 isoform X1 [Vigna umbellata]